MGKFWKDLCNVNDKAYVDYKRIGPKETALIEINRHQNKAILQHEALKRRIKPDAMLDF